MAKLPKEFQELDTPSNKIKRYTKIVFKWIEFALFVSMIIITFFISEKLAKIILNVDINTMKQIINVILVIIVLTIYFSKNKNKGVK